MYPIIKNSTGELLATLNNITSNVLKQKVNSDYTFNFKCFEEEHKSKYIQFGNVVEVDGQTFDISYIDQSHSVGVEYDVRCEHVSYRLIDLKYENYANTGTPESIMDDLLDGTDFTFGTSAFTTPVVFAVNRNTNRMSVILSLVNSLGGFLYFTNGGFTLNIGELGTDNGYQIRIKKNLKAINKVVDKRGGDKASYKIDLVNVFKSDEMVLKGLENLETLALGDKVQLIDETINVDLGLFVTEIQRDVIKDEQIDVVLGDSFDYLADKVSFIENQAIKQSDIIYGVKINNDVGVEIERSDKLARTVLNADEFRMQTGDGTGNYIDSLYFNPITQEYIFVGKLGANVVDADAIQADAITASKIDVDNLSAISANLGTINAGTINGIVINGSVINAGSTSSLKLWTDSGVGVIDFNSSGTRIADNANVFGISLNSAGTFYGFLSMEFDPSDDEISFTSNKLHVRANTVWFEEKPLILSNGSLVATMADIPSTDDFATKTYVNSGDSSTLSSALSYTQSYSVKDRDSQSLSVNIAEYGGGTYLQVYQSGSFIGSVQLT